MPLAARGSKIDPDKIPILPSSSPSLGALTPRRWSHKKFGRRKRQATIQSEEPSALQIAPSLNPVSTTGLSPRREEKKKKRRESDAKWRSNLSDCFKHLETKVLRARNGAKSRLSKVHA